MRFGQSLTVVLLAVLVVVGMFYLMGKAVSDKNDQTHRFEMECIQVGGHIDKDSYKCTK